MIEITQGFTAMQTILRPLSQVTLASHFTLLQICVYNSYTKQQHLIYALKPLFSQPLTTYLGKWITPDYLSYSGDALRSFNVQPTSKLCRNVRKRLFSLRI